MTARFIVWWSSELMNRLISYSPPRRTPDYWGGSYTITMCDGVHNASNTPAKRPSKTANLRPFSQLGELSKDEVVRHARNVVAHDARGIAREGFPVTRRQGVGRAKVILEQGGYHHFGVL